MMLSKDVEYKIHSEIFYRMAKLSSIRTEDKEC